MAELDNWPKVTLFGDSITRLSMDPNNGNWASYLAHELGDYYQVDIKGFSGYTTRFAAKLARQLFTKRYLQNVDLFFLFFGHNDAWQSPFFPGISVEEYEANMHEILDWLESNGLQKENIIVITPGWYDQQTFSNHRANENKADVRKTKEHSIKYADATKKICHQRALTCVDWWKLTIDYKPFDKLFYDGLHLSQIGAKCLFELIWPVVRTKIENKHDKPIEDLAIIDCPEELSEARRKSLLNN